MNYWFLYNLSDGSIYGAPYLGFADRWDNIPDGCGVIGPISESDATDDIKKAFANPAAYLVADEKIAINNNYVTPQPTPHPPAELERLAAVELAVNALLGL